MASCCLLTVDALIGLKGNLRYLRRGLSELAIQEEVVKESIRICKLRKLIVEEKVESWLAETALFIDQVNELLLHYIPFCRKLWSIGRVAERVAHARVVMTQLIKDGKFANVGYKFPPVLPQTPEKVDSTDGTVGLTWAFETAWYLLVKEEETKVIAIHGLPGVGKTTLLRKVRDALGKRSNNFDTIIQVWDGKPWGIQDSILEQLNVPYSSISIEEKASMINTVLANKRCILLLDCVQRMYNLEDLGVMPLDASLFKSKIVVAFHSKKNLKYPLKWQKIIEIQPLMAEEAWDLLKMQLPRPIPRDKTHDMARGAVNTCGGMPLAVKAICNGMIEADYAENGTDVLRFIGNHEVGVYSYILKWMEDNWFNWDTSKEKMFLILCSLFPAASLIRRDQLIEYWKDWKLGNVDLVENTVQDVYRILEEFESEGLLEERGKFVTLNPLLCRMAMWIASDYGNRPDKCFVLAGGHWDVIPSIKWEEVETVSLMDNQIKVLDREVLICHNLTTMILSKNKLYSINNHFFDSMPVLRFLDLSWSEIELLPEAICNLITLKTLKLSHTHLDRLPPSLGNLVNLQTLDLSHIPELCVFPSGVISRLVMLQSLNLFCSGYEMLMGISIGTCECRIGSLSFLKELDHSLLLDDLGLCITGETTLEELKNLKKTRTCITSLSIVNCEWLKTLTLSSIDFENLENFEISKCNNLKDFKVDIGGPITSFFNRLDRVTIKECWVLEELSWVGLIPNLTSLKVDTCMSIKTLINDSVIKDTRGSRCLFQAIRHLNLLYLPELTFINEDPLSFDNLEDVTVVLCGNLKKLPFDEISGLDSLKTIRGQRAWWDQLEWADTQTRHAFFPYFVEIDSSTNMLS